MRKSKREAGIPVAACTGTNLTGTACCEKHNSEPFLRIQSCPGWAEWATGEKKRKKVRKILGVFCL